MSTINGKVCVVDGVAVDKVFSNDKQVYGRNLLLDTNFNNLPQYWTARSGTVTGTFNGHNIIYYDATKLTNGSIDALQQPIYNPSADSRTLPSQWYILSFYVKGTGQMATYVYGSFVDTGAGSYIDGVASEYTTGDGNHVWDLTDGWIRHTYTFKSKSSFPATGVQNVLWRLFKGNEVYICMPKLEEGTLATPHTPAPEDVLKGDITAPNNLVESQINATTKKLDWK